MKYEVEELINSVDWNDSKLGEWGARVPNLLKILTQLQVEEIEKANQFFESFCSVISYSGDIYELTVATTKILVKFLNHPDIIPKKWILRAIACLSFRGPVKSKIHQQIYDIISENLFIFEKYLDSSDKDIKRFTASILSNLSNNLNPVAIWLCNHISTEKDSNLRIDIFGYLGLLLASNKDIEVDVADYILYKLHPILNSPNPIESGEAAVIYLILQQDKINPTVKQILTNCIQDIDELYEQDWRLRNHLVVTLYKLKINRLDLYLQTLLPELKLDTIQRLIFNSR